MGRQIKNISGFFFDEDKEKYFPNHMKSWYEKERKAKKEKIKDQNVDYNSQNLDRFMMISRQSCDFILQKLERCQVHEIIWPNDIQIIANENKYFRYSCLSFSTLCTFEEVQLDTDAETQNQKISDLCVYDKLGINIKILKFGFLDVSNKYFYTLQCDNSESSNESPILRVFEINFAHQVKLLEAKYRLRLDLNNPLVVTDSGGFIYEYGEFEKDDKDFRTKSKFRFIEMEISNNVLAKKKENLKISKEVTCFQKFSMGLIVACTGGKLYFDVDNDVDNDNDDDFRINKNKAYQLEESAVKWMHYHEKMLLVFTFHGNFVLINLETGHQQVLFKLSDLSVHSNNNFNYKFEDFKIEAVGKIILVGYRNGTEIAVYNFLEISRGPIRTFSFQKKVEQFKISADFLHLYIHHLD